MAIERSHEEGAHPPPAACWNCHRGTAPGARYCPHCGHRQEQRDPPRQPTIRGTVIDAGVPTWPPPPAPLIPTERNAPSDEVFAQRPNFSSVRSHPVEVRLAQTRRASDETTMLLRRSRADVWPVSGPLDKTTQMPRVQKPPAEPPPSSLIDQLPAWLLPAATGKQQAITPDFLQPSGRSGPIFDAPQPASSVSRPEPYPPFPDGLVSCDHCGGRGSDYRKWQAGTPIDWTRIKCDVCGGKGRVQPVNVIPQPAPAADVTGPTAAALEAIQPVITLELPETAETRQHEAERLARILARRTQVASIRKRIFENLGEVKRQIGKTEEWRDTVEELVLAARGEDKDSETLETLQRVGKGITTILQHLQGSLMYADFTHGWLGEAIQADDKLLGPLVRQEGEKDGNHHESA